MKFGIRRAGKRRMFDRFFEFVESHSAGDRLLVLGVIAVLCGSLIWIGILTSMHASQSIPANGGVLTEGIVGSPRFINPVLAVTRADRDMTSLIYAGLTRLGEDGDIVPDLAESITVSEDGLVYNVVLRSDVTFHDGAPVTAADVAYTVRQIQSPLIASPLRASWEDVSVEVLGEHELNFILPEAYAPFIENLTVGILPQHIWADASDEEFPFSQHNSEPVGSGPYKIREIIRDTSGIPSSYRLAPFGDYHRGEPQITDITLKFYANEDRLINAFNAREIDSFAGISPEAVDRLFLDRAYEIQQIPLPRTFAVFFNQNKSEVLRDRSVRRALDAAVDRNLLIDRVLSGYGAALHSPIPPGFGVEIPSVETASSTPIEEARALLRSGGWSPNSETGIWEKEVDDSVTRLSVSISTANTPVFEETAEFIREAWEDLGAEVTVRKFEQSDLTQAIIRPRDYESLLFGTAVGRPLDFYSFWHSSQRNDPGLNVALYANITTDSILSEARTNEDPEERTAAIKRFAEEIDMETPAVFLYSPELIYVLPVRVVDASFTRLAEPHERFANISEWYIETDSVWPFLTNN